MREKIAATSAGLTHSGHPCHAGRPPALKPLRRLATSPIPPSRSHSQITITRHPPSSKSSCVRLSRSTLPPIFASQYSRFVSGMRAPRLQECPCQKHPLMNTAIFHLRKVKSGLPGRCLLSSRNRKPIRCSVFRAINSIEVSFPLTAAIIRLRSSFENTSGIMIRGDQGFRATGTFPVQWRHPACCMSEGASGKKRG